ncbi:glycosyltransferase family 71 protein [Thozetella sp. PMI_491]|nr:glycosyltransferase family 71 protein [Thozetella sp. PMI_491]
MGASRRPRLLLAAATISLLGLTAWYHSSSEVAIKWVSPTPSPVEYGSGGGQGVGQGGGWRAADYNTAHTLPTADDFFQYFRKVIVTPGMTIEEAKSTCNWSSSDPVDFQFGEDADWVQRDRSNKEIHQHRQKWRKFIARKVIPYDEVKDRFGGRGIVILTGNYETMPRVQIIMRALRKLGSTLPIEFHYWDNELNNTSKEQIMSLNPNVTFNDLSGEHNILKPKRDRFWINYQLKTAALVNSRFSEPLLLDSDNIPVIDPEELYESKTYQQFGTIFWPDIARSRPQNPAWAITNTACRMDEYEQESGQLMVDKTRFWYHLQLAAWMNNQQGRYYDKFLLGDKDTFRFAWHALKTQYGRPRKWVTSIGTLNDGFFCGHSFAQHHPDDGRIAFLHGGLAKTVSLDVLKWNREEKGGYFRHYKRSVHDEDPNKITNVTIKWDPADYMTPHSEDFKVASCTDMFDTEARELDEILPGFEAIFEEIGGYWQLDGERPKAAESL